MRKNKLKKYFIHFLLLWPLMSLVFFAGVYVTANLPGWVLYLMGDKENISMSSEVLESLILVSIFFGALLVLAAIISVERDNHREKH